MSRKRFAKARDLFVEALKLPAGSREAWLRGKCPDDETLVREVLELVSLAETTGNPLDQGPFDDDPPALTEIEKLPEGDLAQVLHRLRTLGQLTDETADTAPQEIGPYKILQSIGQGGMGHVFMAQQTEPVKRRVAVKVIRTGTPTKEILARFEAERQALAMMDHQNIARVLDAGVTEDGRPYFAMELVKGIPITEYCDANKLDPVERLDLFVQTCRAIQHAHQKGIIHRDIKPTNVLVTLYDGRPVAKVIDFGLAKALRDSTELTNRTLFTQFGQVVGTLAYMSPEQAEMNALDVDTRTDVYSLGVILYELLTGSTPIGRERIRSEAFDRILALIREEETTRPSARLSESGDAIAGISEQRRTDPRRLSLILKGDLDWIAVKALEKDRTRRYDTVAALVDDLQRYLNDEAIQARPPSFGYRLRKSLRKHKAAFGTVVAIFFVLIAGLLGTGTMWWRATDSEADAVAEAARARAAAIDARLARAAAETETRRAREAEMSETAARQRTQAALARSDYFVAVARWEAGRAKEARAFLDRVPPAHRHFEWYLVRRMMQGSDITLYGHRSSVGSAVFHPNGRTILSSSGRIKLWDAGTGEELRPRHRFYGQNVTISQDGTRLASVSSAKNIELWDVESGEHVRTCTGPVSGISRLAFRPDGRRIVSVCADRTAKLWNTDTGELLKSLKGHSRDVTDVSFSSDGIRVATGSRDGTVRVWEAETGGVRRVLRGGKAWVLGVCFSPDGTRVAAAYSDAVIRLWDVSTGRILRMFNANGQQLCVSFSPDGTRIASGNFAGVIRQWNAVSGEPLGTFVGHTARVIDVDFSPDGTRIVSASADNTVRVWDAVSTSTARTLKNSGRVQDVSFNPSGTRIATCSLDSNTIRVRDSQTCEELMSLTGDRSYDLCFSADDKWILSAGRDGKIRVWDTSTGELLRVLTGHEGSVHSVAISADKRWIASGGEDQSVRLWDPINDKPIRTLATPKGFIFSVCLGPDGAIVASAGHEPAVRVWNTSTGQQIKKLDRELSSVRCVCINPDGTRLASGHFGQVRLWDLVADREISVLKGHTDYVQRLCFSRDGRRMASSGDDGTVRLWDATNGDELVVLRGHRGYVFGVSLDEYGIASGGWDGTVRLWDAPREAETRVLRGHTDWITGVSFSPDGKRLYSRSRNENIVWDTETGEPVDEPWELPESRLHSTPDGRWLTFAHDDEILLVDTHFKNTVREKACRAFKAGPRRWWHQEQAAQAEQLEDWFAATFHRAWAFRLAPDSRTAHSELQRVRANIDANVAGMLPMAVKEALGLPVPATEAAGEPQ